MDRKDSNKVTFRDVDRAILSFMGMVLFVSGAYILSPLYIIDPTGGGSSLYQTMNSAIALKIFGALQGVTGLLLFYLTFHKGAISRKLAAATLLSAFIIRLYILMGILAITNSVVPPTYLTQVSIVGTLGAYWLAVKRRATK